MRSLAGKTKTPPTLHEIRQILRRHQPVLMQRYGIRSVEIFGSYVRGRQKRTSDLDLLVEFDGSVTLSLFDITGIGQELSALLGVRVDLVEKGTVRPALKKRIFHEAVPL